MNLNFWLHEPTKIRTPMNGVIGHDWTPSGNRARSKQRDYAETICSSAKSLLSILNDILDFFKMRPANWSLRIWSLIWMKWSKAH